MGLTEPIYASQTLVVVMMMVKCLYGRCSVFQ